MTKCYIKYHRDDLLIFCVISEAQNADKARTLRNDLMTKSDKLREIYVTNDFTIVRR